jgi:hypothetical protein
MAKDEWRKAVAPVKAETAAVAARPAAIRRPALHDRAVVA